MTIGDIAKTCEVSMNTVKRWIQRGLLKAFSTSGGHLHITVEEFQRFRTVYPFVPEQVESPRILVVDDDPTSIELCRTVLRLLPVPTVVETASGGYEGLLKIGAFHPHMVLLNLQMPD